MAVRKKSAVHHIKIATHKAAAKQHQIHASSGHHAAAHPKKHK